MRATSIKDYHKRLLQNEITCVSAVQFYLDRIRSNESLNAFVEVYEEEALARAVLLDEKRNNGEQLRKLHGVVIAIKDVICYQGHKVTAASGILKDFVSIYTASALQLLLDEDAIIIGNCNCDEFAMGSSNENSVYGKVLNAADPSRVSGGSSGGSAVAVQADMCMLSLGSDTGGSVRQPAGFCGIVGFKPGYGSISRYGLIAYASSFDQIGIFGKNVEDVLLVYNVMNKPDEKDSTLLVNKPNLKGDKDKLRLCYFKEMLEHPSLDKEIAAAIYKLIENLRKEGHEITEMQSGLIDFMVPAYYVLTTAEASSNLSRYDGVRYGQRSNEEETLTEFYSGNRTKGFGKEVKRRIMLGTFVLSTGYYDAYFSKAQQVRQLISQQVTDIFLTYDGILAPTSPTPAFKTGLESKDPTETYLADIYTVMANLCGIASISLPMFSHSYSIPFGVQIMANKGDELSLLAISEKLIDRPEFSAKEL